ncbi:EpsG family protein [Capnocytophaga stomatis]|uniref:EpsG family protein n=1 Tax=Capnocytophaga stomatis TaxID=1848904 RepID=UPI00385DAA22
MLFYFSILILFAFFSFVELFTKQRSISGYLYFLSCTFLFLLSFLRWETGTDWKNYQIYFETILNRSFENDSFEVGFRIMNYLVRFFSDNYTFLLLFSGAILFIFQTKAILNLSLYPMTSLTFLYGIQLGNILFVRQWIAIAILFYSIKFIRNNRFLGFLSLVLIATTIHRSAILFVFAWWLFRSNISFKRMLIILSLSLVFSYLTHHLLSSFLGSLGGAVIQHKLDTYLSDSYNEGLNKEINFTFILIKGVANKLLVLLGAMYIYWKFKDKDRFFRGLINIYWFGCLIYFIMISISLALVRFSYAFDIMQIILITYIFFHFKRIKNRGIVFVIFLGYVSLRLLTFLNSAYQEEIVPYKYISIF